MEVRRTKHMSRPEVRFSFAVLLLLFPTFLIAQQTIKKYSVKDGKMYIEITKDIKQEELKEFIDQFDLQDLYLEQFLKTSHADSLLKQGWYVEKNNETGFIISKPFKPFAKINNPGERIAFTEKHPTLAERFPAVNNGILFGYNKFRNHPPFTTVDSIVIFYLRNHTNAQQVMLAGSFNNWLPNALPMQKTDSGWVATVKLGPGKYWYKFVADGGWIVDSDNMLKENDGYGNINSVFFRTNTLFILNGHQDARKVFLMGSFNNWNPQELLMNKKGNGWELPLYLSKGTHSYKFVVDGVALVDEQNNNRVPDGKGGSQSLIQIGKPHVFTLKGYNDARDVRLVGSFNKWKDYELPMNRTASGWELAYVLGPGNYEYKFIVDGTPINDPLNPPPVQNGNSYLIIEPNYTFRLKGHPDAKSVFLAGDFNGWNPKMLAMTKQGDEWVLPVHLPVGKRLYKFIVDGEWIKDPNNKLWEQNEFGTGNSIVWIDK